MYYPAIVSEIDSNIVRSALIKNMHEQDINVEDIYLSDAYVDNEPILIIPEDYLEIAH